MKKAGSIFLAVILCGPLLWAHEFAHAPGFPKVPEGLETIGDGHGEVAVASNGEIYVSVQGGARKGIQVYSPEGEYVRNVKGAPNDFHGFVIHEEEEGEFIYGVGLWSGNLSKLRLDGSVIFESEVSAIPKDLLLKKDGKINPRFTSCDVAPDGTIYVVDGYGKDNIHLFDKEGKYLKSWIGWGEPYKFKNLHKIFIDLRYDEPRILGCDRGNQRLVHLTLDGELLGDYATGLRRPSAAAFYGDEVAIAEIEGRISVWNKDGEMVAEMGVNDDPYNGNRTPPEKWREGVVTSPHGIAYDAEGNILMTEYSKFGRILKYSPRK